MTSIKGLCCGSIVQVSGEASLQEVAAEMDARCVGLAVVSDTKTGRGVLGVITDRDIVTRAIALGLNPAMTQVNAVMTRGPVLMPETRSVADALNMMASHRVRRILVVDAEQKVTGVVSTDDLIIFLSQQAKELSGELETLKGLLVGQDGTSARHTPHDFTRMA